MKWWTPLTAVCVLIGSLAIAGQERYEIATAAASAKARGETILRMGDVSVPLYPLGLRVDNVLGAYSAVLISHVGPLVGTTVGRQLIYSWRPVTIDRVIRQRAQIPVECSEITPLTTAAPKQVYLRNRGGSAEVNGVTVIREDYGVQFIGADRFLVIATICPDGNLFIPHAVFDIFTVSADGALGSYGWVGQLPDFILSLRTLDAVQAYEHGMRY